VGFVLFRDFLKGIHQEMSSHEIQSNDLVVGRLLGHLHKQRQLQVSLSPRGTPLK